MTYINDNGHTLQQRQIMLNVLRGLKGIQPNANFAPCAFTVEGLTR